MSGGDRMQDGKSMSIMNTQQSSREKDESSIAKNITGNNDNRTSSTNPNTSLSSDPPVAKDSGSSNGVNSNSNLSASVTGGSSLESSSISGSHLSSTNIAGNIPLVNQGRDPKS